MDNSCYTLFQSYLSNRFQCTVVDGQKSKFKELKAGIPQGSKLGPLLWLLYVNDIVNDIESDFFSFCWRYMLFCLRERPSWDCFNFKQGSWAPKYMGYQMESIFPIHQKVKINFLEKTYFLNSPPLVLNGEFVECVHEHKHLGIYLNTSLSWARQIHETCLRANRKLAVLWSIRFLKRSTLDLLYKVYVTLLHCYTVTLLHWNKRKLQLIIQLHFWKLEAKPDSNLTLFLFVQKSCD